jgi:hypothetical protein
MKNLIFVVACLVSVSVNGQKESLLHQATRDSVSYVGSEYEISGWSDKSFEFALFDAIQSGIFLYGDTIDHRVTEWGDNKAVEEEYEYRLKSLNEEVLLFHMISYREWNENEHHSTIHIDIKSNNKTIASYSSLLSSSPPLTSTESNSEEAFNYEDFKRQFDLEMARSNKKEKTVSNYTVLSNDRHILEEGAYLTETCKLTIDCDFNCFVNKLHQVGYNFGFNYKGGYNVWEIEVNH